jgi:environmental stress-induced protein Ves
MRWKNGGGTTTQILVEPQGAARLAWRVSVADVAASGPFSSFPGYERHIVVIEGGARRGRPARLALAAYPRGSLWSSRRCARSMVASELSS